ncbi:MAG: hypothetical protein WCR04_12565 [Fibrobacteraceae bacterium]
MKRSWGKAETVDVYGFLFPVFGMAGGMFHRKFFGASGYRVGILGIF